MPIYIEETGANLLMWSLIVNGFLLGRHRALAGAKVDTMYIYLKGDHGYWGVPKKMWDAAGTSIMSRIGHGTFDIKTLKTKTIEYGTKTFVLCDLLSRQSFGMISPESIRHSFVELRNLAYRISDIGLIPPASDIGHSLFTRRMLTLLRSHLHEARVPELMNLLMVSTRMTINREEQMRLYEIALEISGKLKGVRPTAGAVERVMKRMPSIEKKLGAHLKKYAWLPYNYQGPAWNTEVLVDRIGHFLISAKRPALAARQFKGELAVTAKEQRRVVRSLKFSRQEKFIITVAQEFWYLKAYRAEVRCRANFILDKLLREVGRRFGIPWKLLHHADPEEVIRMLRTGKRLDPIKLKRRSRELFWLCIRGKKRIWSGRAARRKFLGMVEQKTIGDASHIEGQTAYPGIVRGRVAIVESAKDIRKVKYGDIMVAIATNPDLLPAMNRAAAFVTDAGGITSHAAIVAREMKKPCIIGTEYATKVLKDGDTIIVDARQGIIRKLKG